MNDWTIEQAIETKIALNEYRMYKFVAILQLKMKMHTRFWIRNIAKNRENEMKRKIKKKKIIYFCYSVLCNAPNNEIPCNHNDASSCEWMNAKNRMRKRTSYTHLTYTALHLLNDASKWNLRLFSFQFFLYSTIFSFSFHSFYFIYSNSILVIFRTGGVCVCVCFVWRSFLVPGKSKCIFQIDILSVKSGEMCALKIFCAMATKKCIKKEKKKNCGMRTKNGAVENLKPEPKSNTI